jgi:hypothetical protein
MKKFLFGLIATVLFSISLHSQDYVTYIRTIETPKIENNEFNFDFKSFDFKNSLIGGKILIGKEIVDLEMNISKGISISEIKEITVISVIAVGVHDAKKDKTTRRWSVAQKAIGYTERLMGES